MKKIAIQIDWEQRKKNNLYHLRLGNGTIYEFTSKRIGQNFVNKTNKFLSEKWYNFFNLYNQVFTEYSSCTGYFHNKENHKGFRFQDTNIRKLLHQLEDDLNYMIGQSRTLNGNYTAFSNLNNISSELIKAILILKSLHSHRSNAQQITGLNFLIQQIHNQNSELNGWGLEMCVDRFENIKVVEMTPLKAVNE